MAGKDRTGLVTALLLRLAGVPREAVGDDYAVTEINLREATERWIAEAQTDEERDFRRRVSATPAEAMVGVLEELEERHGGVDAYLLAGRATRGDLDTARARLLE
jgi:protein tyrosine/serine phosphatase